MAVRQPARVAFGSVVLGVVLAGASPGLAAGSAGQAPQVGTTWPVFDPSLPPFPTAIPTLMLSPVPQISVQPPALVPPVPSLVPRIASPSGTPNPAPTAAARTRRRPAGRTSVGRDPGWSQVPAAPAPVIAPQPPVQLLPSRPSAADVAGAAVQDASGGRDRLPESMIMAGAVALVFAGGGLVFVGRRRRTW